MDHSDWKPVKELPNKECKIRIGQWIRVKIPKLLLKFGMVFYIFLSHILFYYFVLFDRFYRTLKEKINLDQK